MSTGETEAQVYPGISNFQTVLTSFSTRCDFLYLIKMRTYFCHVLFLPDACVRLGPALILPTRDVDDNFLWSEPLHIGTYDSSDIRICMYTCILITYLGTLLHYQGSTSLRGTAGDHEGPPSHSSPPSPLREGYFPERMESLTRQVLTSLSAKDTIA